MSSSESSVSQCLDRIRHENLDLNQFFICKNKQGLTYLREKSLLEKIGIKLFSDRTDTDFSGLASSAVSMLEEIEKKGASADWIPTAQKIYGLVSKVMGKAQSVSYDDATRAHLKTLNEKYRAILRLQGKTVNVPLDPVLRHPLMCVDNHNTAFHILAHVPAYAALLDPDLNPLTQRVDESEEIFNARKVAQQEAFKVVQEIWEGADFNAADFFLATNVTLGKMEEPAIRMNNGDDAMNLIRVCEKLFGNQDFKFEIDITDSKEIKMALTKWHNPSKPSPSVIQINNKGCSNSFPFEVKMGEATYRLEAIAEDGKLGTMIPLLRRENGQFVRLSHREAKAQVVGEKERRGMSQYNWKMYYSKVEQAVK